MPKLNAHPFKPLAVEMKLALSGGCLREPRVLRLTEIDGSEYVEVGKSVDWVCQLIAGSSRSGSPLKCVKLIDDLRKQIGGVTGADARDDDDAADADDPMAALMASGSTRSKNRRTRSSATDSRKSSGCARGSGTPTPVQVKLPSGELIWACNDVGGKPKCHVDVQVGKLYVRVDGLSAFLTALRTDFDSMGVDEDGDDDEEEHDASKPSLCFAHRDCAWVATYTDLEGVRKRRRFHVPKCEAGSKKYLSEEAYAEERDRARERAENWLQACARGVP